MKKPRTFDEVVQEVFGKLVAQRESELRNLSLKPTEQTVTFLMHKPKVWTDSTGELTLVERRQRLNLAHDITDERVLAWLETQSTDLETLVDAHAGYDRLQFLSLLSGNWIPKEGDK